MTVSLGPLIWCSNPTPGQILCDDVSNPAIHYEHRNDLFKLYLNHLTEEQIDAGEIQIRVLVNRRGWTLISIPFDPWHVRWYYDAQPIQIKCAVHRIIAMQDDPARYSEMCAEYDKLYRVCARTIQRETFAQLKMIHPTRQSHETMLASLPALTRYLNRLSAPRLERPPSPPPPGADPFASPLNLSY